ncbi:hypothetical protein D3C85_1613300 [compost metagenome]
MALTPASMAAFCQACRPSNARKAMKKPTTSATASGQWNSEASALLTKWKTITPTVHWMNR